MAEGTSRYGLILKRPYKKLPQVPRPNVFGDSSDEDGVSSTSKKPQVATDVKMRSQFSVQIEKALEEDPNAFAYDEVYEKIEKDRNNSRATAKEKDGAKPKYITALLKNAKKRQVEYEAREERKQQREREKEGGEFADKEVFVTGAYRRKLEELEEHNKAVERMDRIDEMMDVSKQKDLSGFYRHFLNDVAQPVSSLKDSETAAEQSGDQKGTIINRESKMPKKRRA
uniref:DUF2040 domain-containing protein n=1 Tax=Trichuris muris TaxID=70415 RepID=A0A5S6QM72_TRIMR